VTAKCIYCREVLGPKRPHVKGACYFPAECRDRMRDREKRIVRVFWRVCWLDLTEEYDIRPRVAFLRRRAHKTGKSRHHKFCRVIVRRKAKE